MWHFEGLLTIFTLGAITLSRDVFAGASSIPCVLSFWSNYFAAEAGMGFTCGPTLQPALVT